jgi:hypothetical protein
MRGEQMDSHPNSLFDQPKPISSSLAPTDTPATPSKEENIARQREQLESRLANHELDDVRTRVAYVLNQYPSCRNSDVELAIRFWKLFHPDEVGRESVMYEALRNITPMTSITRARATIQNQFGMFVAEETVLGLRDEREQQVRHKQRASCG